MSQFHINRISKQLEKELANEWQKTKLEHVNNLTRYLAYKIAEFELQDRCTNDDYIIDITDGGGDAGIDAVGVHLVDKIVVLVQSKFRQKSAPGSLEKEEILKFTDGVRFMLGLNGEEKITPGNKDLLKSKVFKQAREVIEEFDSKLIIATASTGTSDEIPGDNLRSVREILDAINVGDVGAEDDDSACEYVHYSQQKIYSKFAGDKQSIDLELNLLAYNEYEENNKKVFYGRINTSEISSWYQENGSLLFSRNIRTGIIKSSVNDGIRHTLENEPENFLLFNNGITIIAEKISRSIAGSLHKDSINLKLNNMSIVNGAQTVSTIAKYFDSADSDGHEKYSSFVIVKIIEVPKDSEELGQKITRYANTQNEVASQDFAYLDDQQHRLVRELADLGIEYNIRNVESYESVASDNHISMREAAVALACSNKDIRYTVIAKGAAGKLFDTTSQNSNYKAIFNPSTDPLLLQRSVKLLRSVNRELDKISGDNEYNSLYRGIATHGRLFITHLLIQELGIKNLKDPDAMIDFESFNDFIEAKMYRLFEIFSANNAAAAEDDATPLMYPGNVFKNQQRVRLLKDKVLI